MFWLEPSEAMFEYLATHEPEGRVQSAGVDQLDTWAERILSASSQLLSTQTIIVAAYLGGN
ncbi:MAG TPA: hypothetical protein VFG30_00315 [Polyangiales bacterium]|nr:hypothetical protein [Polyangiales bacterium]